MASNPRKTAKKTATTKRSTITKSTRSTKTPKRTSNIPHEKKSAGANVSLRMLTEADDAFLLQSTRQTMKEVFEKSVGVELTDKLILEQIKSSGVTLIIEQGCVPIGYTCYTLYKPKRMYWGALVLLPTAQGHGIGSRICDNLYEHARQLGCEAIDGHVQVHNEVAVKFWKSQGFEVVGGPTAGSYEIEKKLR
ncbi:GNAT family N-acetyltransferase [Tumebacillus permanentifrigoris]|uniref:Acetyltransferase (GNAT) family protein n=1 Tax=Tumebacillus permanentifrigoris TaxID=378543 RepID=A0A316DWT8_9BACL|nr:GNAT family N-acetyltransferase [Tumebacillus permanentifrigoris]PWK14304.1 acetyltransferase (GNAT) family protein [Tumebacillus permanentifrigoris]